MDNKYLSALLRFFKRRVLRTGSTVELIDLARSLAFSPEHAGMFGCINLTETGRERAGFREELARALRALPEELAGVRQVEVFLREDLYRGPHVALAPDILFVVNGHRSSVEIDLVRPSF